MNEAVLIQAEDWEGLFINGKLVEEGHTLEEGCSRIKYFCKLANKYKFDLKEMKEYWVTEEYEEYLSDCGGFPNDLSEVEYE